VIRAVVWKELREQGPIALVLAVLGGGLLVATALLADPPIPGAPPTDVIRALGAARLVTLMLIVTAGMVCGGALFAAEKEAGTMAFLDALPAGRWPLWRAKLVAGLVLAVATVGALAAVAVAAAADVVDVSFVGRAYVYAVLAFAWGILGSTLARTTLGSVGVAIPAATLAAFAFLLPITVFSAPAGGVPRHNGWLLFEVLMLTTPLALSLWRFTAPDRARAAVALDAPQARPSGGPVARPPGGARRAGFGVGALVWLAVRQLRGPGAVLSAFALAFGAAMLLPDLRPVFLWPVLALTAGTLTGVLAFGDEQGQRSAPFWSERRLPLARAWWVKLGVAAALLAWLLVLLTLPNVVRAASEQGRRGLMRLTFAGVFQSRLFDDLGPQTWKYLLVPAAYGFAAGHLCGLLFRKLVVACGVAGLVGGAAAALWVPSFLAGGLSHWQVWLPPALALLTARLLIRAWAADRLTVRGPLLRAAGGGCAAFAALAAGLGYRAVEVPDDPTGAADLTYVAEQPSYDDNKAGREFRAAVERFSRATDEGPPGPFDARTATLRLERRMPRFHQRLGGVLQSGWREDDPELSDWLDRVYAEQSVVADDKPWYEQAAAAANRPIGIFESPALFGSVASSRAALDGAAYMARVLLVQALRFQAREQPAAVVPGFGSAAALGRHLLFVPSFRTAVTLARNLRNGSGALALEAGQSVERAALAAAQRWLERLGPGDDLAGAVGGAAAEADEAGPYDPLPYALADRYVVRTLMQAPASWLAPSLLPPGASPDQPCPEGDFVAFGWSVPWERERTRRLAGQLPAGLAPGRMSELVRGRPGAAALTGPNRPATDLAEADAILRVSRRAVILTCAIRAHTAARGGPPAALGELVGLGYLARMPEDPFAPGKEFGYRVSAGEMLPPTMPRVPVLVLGPEPLPQRGSVNVPTAGTAKTLDPGQPLFWSVGLDRTDEGGRVPPGGARPTDLVFIVPPPAVEKK
jgi:hypothetical protein